MTKIPDLRGLDLLYPLRPEVKYSQVNRLIMAAYQHSKVETEAIMIHARTRACLKLALRIAQHLELVYFGYQDLQSWDVFKLQFNNQERPVEYIKKLKMYFTMFGKVDSLGRNNNLVQLHRFERTWFIYIFWQRLLSPSSLKKTLKQGLKLSDLEQALSQKQKRMGILLGGELESLDLIINTITPNAY